MQTIRDACQLQPHALSIKLSDQIEQLDELITAEGDGAQFFEKTYITQGMQDLISEGIARLAGVSTQGIFHLKQAMDGGKTHLLVGFGLLAKHPALRKQYCGSIPHAQAFEMADIAAFNGRNNPDHFLWGEIANQLGKGEQLKTFWTSGPKAPDEKDWLKLFDGGTPSLILLDEMPPYFHYLDTQKVGNGTVADIATRAFANLITAAGKKRNVCVVVSDLAASYDTGTRLINRVGEVPVHAAFLGSILKSVLDLEKFTPDTPITMSFRKAHFASGYDLKHFADTLGIALQPEDVEQ